MRFGVEASVRRKLLGMSIAASLSALTFASTAFVVYDFVTFREELLTQLETEAEIIGANTVSALVFDDEREAAGNLEALRAEPHVLAGTIYGSEGELYARWSRLPSHVSPSRLPVGGFPAAKGIVVASRPIVFDGNSIGTIVIEADLGERIVRFQRYVLIVILVSVGSLLLVIPVSDWLQRVISDRIVALAGTARAISRNRDYSVRAKEEGRDEIGLLIRTFNDMLEQIQLRDAELQEARSDLERRVELRTAEMEQELAERRRAENALRQSELMLAEAQRLAHVGSWEWDVAQDRLRWSDELYRIYGLDSRSFRATYEAFLERVHPDDRAIVHEGITSAGRVGGPFSFDHRIVRPDGAVRTLHVFGNAELDGEGRLVRAIGTGQDITDRERAEKEREALIRAQAAHAETQAAEKRAALLAEFSSKLSASLEVETSLSEVVRLPIPEFADWCAIYLVDGEAIRLIAAADTDPSYERLAWELQARYPMGTSEPARIARVISRNSAETIGEASEDELRIAAKDEAHLRRLQALGLRAEMVVPLAVRGPSFGAVSLGFRRSDRSFSRLDLSLAENIAGRIAVAIANARLYREAQEANRIKDEFLATLSHELRTPLNSIVGWARLLQMGRLDRETTLRAVDTIDRNARMQAQLIEDILDVSRIVAGKLQLQAQPVDLVAVVDAALDSVRPAAEAKEIRLVRRIDPGGVTVWGDPARLQQVAWNLLSNAIKFTPRGGRVEIRLRCLASNAELAVSDTGIGIESAFLPHVFDRFRQADASSTRSHGGLGLGLSIVKHLVELHGGQVEAESEGSGRGATFRLQFPVRAQRGPELPALPPAPPENEVAPARLAGLTILVVDDEPDTRHLLGTVLEGLGARVITVDSAEGALAAFGRTRLDLLISDIEMPGLDGYGLIRKIRSFAPDRGGSIPAAALTAYARSEDRLKALLAGFNVHIAKPVQPAELVAVVLGLVRGPASL